MTLVRVEVSSDPLNKVLVFESYEWKQYVVESGEPTKGGHTCFPTQISHHTSRWMLCTYNNKKVIYVLHILYVFCNFGTK
jgi:hypothetical protein